MEVGIVPVKAGYVAVALPPFKGEWNLHAPGKIPEDILVQLRGQILQKLALYCAQIAPWQSMAFLSVLWGSWSIAAIALCRLWSLGTKYAVLYMWIRFFFFGDGIWALGQTIRKIPQMLKAARIRREAAKAEWTVTVDMPKYSQANKLSERDYISGMIASAPELKPYYDRILRTEPPLAFSWWPLGVSGFIRRVLLGPRIPEPNLIFELGRVFSC